MAESNRDEIAKLESMYAANPEGRVFTHLAEAYRKAGDLSRAREVLDEGLRRHQDSASGYVVLGRVLQDSGDSRQASDAFGRVLDLDPENRVALRALGDLSRAAGEPKQALTYFEQLRSLDPSDELDDVIAEISAQIPPEPVAPVVELPLEPVSPYAMPQEPPQFTPADFPQDLTSLDLGGLSQAEEIAKAEAAGSSPWGEPAAEPGPAEVGEASLASLESEPVQAGGSFTQAPSLADFGFGSADAAAPPPTLEGLRPVEGLETVEPMEVTPLEGLEPEEAQAGTLPPAREYEAPSAQDSAFAGMADAFDIAPGDDLAAAPFGEPPSGEMVTETMAELYRSQGHLVQAAEVYRALLRDRPGDEQLERKLLEVELAILSPEAPGTPAPDSGAAAWFDEAEATVSQAPAAPEPIAELPVESTTGAEGGVGWVVEEPSEATPDALAEPQPSADLPPQEEWAAAEPTQAWPVSEATPQDEWATAESAPQEWATAESAQQAEAAESAPQGEWAASEPTQEWAETAPPAESASAEPSQDEWAAAPATPSEEWAPPVPDLAEEPTTEGAEPAAWEAASPLEAQPTAWEAPADEAQAEPEMPAWQAPAPEAPEPEPAAWDAPAAEQAAEPEAAAWEAPTAESEGQETVVPATEEAWVTGGEMATSEATPYAWETGAPEEANGPPVSGYLRSLLDWHRSTNGAAEATPFAPPAEPTADAWAERPQAPREPTWADEAAAPAEPTWADEAAAPAEPTWAEEAAASPEAPWAEPASPPEPTWADEAAGQGGEPWAEEPPAPAWEPPAAAAAEPAPEAQPGEAEDRMAWLTGPEGIAPEQPEGASQPTPPQEAPGDDDDLEMFRAWLQSLKK